MIKENILSVKGDISLVCERLGRNPDEVVFIGVTKYAEAVQVKEVVAAGVRHIGENRVQDAKAKFTALDNLKGITKHLIGHLQTNKVKEAVELFDLIQSVDSLKVAREIEKQSAKFNKVMDILIEVNVSGEEQKYGFVPEDVMAAVKEMSSFAHVRILGLMTMAPMLQQNVAGQSFDRIVGDSFVEDRDVIRNCFRGLKKLFEEIKCAYSDDSNINMKYLSMGMTADYEIALEEGANMVRIGRAMFA